MKLLFLGTTASIPTKDRNASALALAYRGEVLLFDCGEGTQRQLMLSNLSFMKVKKIFISHFHGDHFLGISGLLQSFSLNKRKPRVEIYGPVETVKFMKRLMEVGYFGLTFPIEVKEMAPGEKLDFGNYTVTAIKANHPIPTLAYLFKEKSRPGRFNKEKALALGVPEGKSFGMLQRGRGVTLEDKSEITPDMVMGPERQGRSMFYTGDTAPCEDITVAAKGVSVLVHEATFMAKHQEKGNEFGHSSAGQAATLAKEAGAKKLFLTHISPRYKEEEEDLLEEALDIFPQTELAEDFLEYEVKAED